MTQGLHRITLDNGFRAFLLRRGALPVVASALYYRVGSRDERSGESGVSHFLEHMMFKGTSSYAKGEIDALTNRLGGSNNAFTDHDSTAYYFALAADRWHTALDIEADRMTNCLLDPAEFAAEKSVVLEELAMGEDDPWRQLWEATEALAFNVHGYRRPIIGYREDLEHLTPAGMRGFYERHYGPNRSFLVVVGDIDVADTERRIAKRFGRLRPVAEREPVLAEPDLEQENRAVIRAPGGITRISMAARTCRLGEVDDFALDLIGHALGHGKSSRLYKRLVVDDEVATDIWIHNEPRLDPGLFWINAELRVGEDPERAEALIRDELDRLAQDGLTPAELKRARIQVRSSFLFEDETVLDTALKIGRFEAAAADGVDLLAKVLESYDGLGRKALKDTVHRWFGADRWTVVWSLPEDAPAWRPKVGRPRRKRAPAAPAEASA